MQQHSLFDDKNVNLAGLMPAIRAAMNQIAGDDLDGRKLLVDKINAVARAGNLRLVGGNAKGVTKDILDKWLAPGDKDHKASVEAVAVFCLAAKDYSPLEELLKPLGLSLATPQLLHDAKIGRAYRIGTKARKSLKTLLETDI